MKGPPCKNNSHPLKSGLVWKIMFAINLSSMSNIVSSPPVLLRRSYLLVKIPNDGKGNFKYLLAMIYVCTYLSKLFFH